MKPLASVPVWASGFVTVTLTAPVACEGVDAVIDVASTTITFAAGLPPMVTEAPELKFDPLIAIGVPPSVVPDAGLTADTVGPV